MTFNIQLSGQELELIGKLISEHPYKLVAPLIQNINEQIQEQLKHDEARTDA